jgi:hypothetical protein
VGQNLNDKIAFILGRREYAHAVAAEYACPNNSPFDKTWNICTFFPEIPWKNIQKFCMVGARRRKNGWTSRSLYTCVQVIGFLHCGGPFGVVVPAPPFLLCGGLHFGGFFDTGLGGWSCGFALFFYRR